VARAFAKAEIINTYGATLTDTYAASRRSKVFIYETASNQSPGLDELLPLHLSRQLSYCFCAIS
jgi:hypothetical protein